MLLLCCCFSSSYAANFYVSTTGSLLSGCGSISNPCKTIQLGIDATTATTDVVNVEAGIYSGIGNEGLSFAHLNKNLVLQGSGLSDEVIVRCKSRDGFLDLDGSGFSVISNLTIEDCGRGKIQSDFGGGLGITNYTTNSISLDHLIFTNNTAYRGGALQIVKSTVTITNLTCNSNTAVNGGCMSVSGEAVVNVINSNFYRNQAEFSGGGIEVVASVLSIYGGRFSQNSVKFGGGAISSTKAHALTISNNTRFDFNSAVGDDQCTGETCTGSGGAIESLDTVSTISDCLFEYNSANSQGDQEAQGGAITFSAIAQTLTITDSFFYSNNANGLSTASASGGAVSVDRGTFVMTNCVFEANYVLGISDFSQSSSNGGAVLIERVVTSGLISYCTFSLNNIFNGGSGGAVQIEDAIGIIVSHATFIANQVESSYSNKALGGALSVVEGSSVTVSDCLFVRNVAGPSDPAEKDDPLTLSGNGGAIFVQSSDCNMTRVNATANEALTGMFDDGAIGGAVLFENALTSSIQYSEFVDNKAYGSEAYSSYGNSGQGGGIGIKFSTCHFNWVNFEDNYVSAGGFASSVGGAVSVLFSPDTNDLSLVSSFQNCVFDSNIADGSVGSSATYRAGHGGALSLLSASVSFINSTFVGNSATTTAAAFVVSFGGAIVQTYNAQTYFNNCTFDRNKAVSGFGDDVATISAEGTLSANMSIVLDDCTFIPYDRSARATASSSSSSSESLFVSADQKSDSISSSSSSDLGVGRANLITIPPSLLISGGQAVLINPNFHGEISIFIGNLLKIVELLDGDVNDVASMWLFGPSETLDSIGVTMINSNLSILPISVINASTVTVLTDLSMINSTLHTTIPLLVKNESYLMGAEIGGAFSATEIDGACSLLFLWDVECPTVSQLGMSAMDVNSPVLPAQRTNVQFLSTVHFGWQQIFLPPQVPAIVNVPLPSFDFVKLSHVNIMIDKEAVFSQRLSSDSTQSTIYILSDGNAVLSAYPSSTVTFAKDTVIHSSNPNSTVFVNNGTIEIDSTSATLNVTSGIFQQACSGVMMVSLNADWPGARFFFQDFPRLSGLIDVSVEDDFQFNIGDEWNLFVVKNMPDDEEMNVSVDGPSGAGFALEEVGNGGVFGLESIWVDCDFMGTFVDEAEFVSSCVPCLDNTSCVYCDTSSNTTFQGCSLRAGRGSKCPNGELQESNCCDNECGNHGTCDDNLKCQCEFFYTGGTCETLSTNGTLIITTSVFLSFFLFASVGYGQYTKKQKENVHQQTLNDIRQGVLYSADDELEKSTNQRNFSRQSKAYETNESFIESLQKDLILRDVLVDFKEIHLEVKVGEGAYGVVYRATFRNETVAVKTLKTPVMYDFTDEDVEHFKKEAYLMSRLRHPNIVMIMGVSVSTQNVDIPRVIAEDFLGADMVDRAVISGRALSTDSPDMLGNNAVTTRADMVTIERKTISMVTEYFDRGSLQDLLNSDMLDPSVWTYERVLSIALQAARGMLFLHSQKPPICHRDLKSSNLLVDEHWVVKVTDFGMSRITPKQSRDQPQMVEYDEKENSGIVGFFKKMFSPGSARRKSTVDDVPESPMIANKASLLSKDAARYSQFDDLQPGKDDDEVDIDAPRERPSTFQMLGSFAAGIFGAKPEDEVKDEADYVIVGPPVSTRPSFGARPSEAAKDLVMTSNMGTIAWAAPEMFSEKGQVSYSLKVDIYSFGIVLWEIFERKMPFSQYKNRFDIMDAVSQGKRPPISLHCPDVYKALIKTCWHQSPRRRPTFQRIVTVLKDELGKVKKAKALLDGPVRRPSEGHIGAETLPDVMETPNMSEASRRARSGMKDQDDDKYVPPPVPKMGGARSSLSQASTATTTPTQTTTSQPSVMAFFRSQAKLGAQNKEQEGAHRDPEVQTPSQPVTGRSVDSSNNKGALAEISDVDIRNSSQEVVTETNQKGTQASSKTASQSQEIEVTRSPASSVNRSSSLL